MIPNPHDALFKAVLGQPEHARGTLRAIVPAPVAEALNWSSLTLCPGSFVDPALAQQHADLLYSTVWRGGEDVLLYVLFEHQSAPPTGGLMAPRLLRYQVRIWERWCIAHPNARTLPAILPVIMYHGLTPWPEPHSFDALLDVPPGMRPTIEPYLVRFSYLLHDLSQIPDEELRQGAMRTALAKLVAMCFKHARTRTDFLDILVRWMDVVREVAAAPSGLQALAQVIRYILEVNHQVGAETLQTLLEREIGSEAKDTVMTTGQQLIEQGLQRGRQEGRQEGIEQGRQQERQEILLRQLRQRFGDAVDAGVEQRIATASAQQIDTWLVRVLSAATLDELFAD